MERRSCQTTLIRGNVRATSRAWVDRPKTFKSLGPFLLATKVTSLRRLRRSRLEICREQMVDLSPQVLTKITARYIAVEEMSFHHDVDLEISSS